MDEIIRFDNVVYSYAAAGESQETMSGPGGGGAAESGRSADGHRQPEPDAGAGGTPALDGVTLSVRRGETVAVLGHNGSGKSTLVRMLNGLLTPLSGTVTVCGIGTGEEDRLLEVRQKVGLVFQNPDNQIVATVVEEDVAFALENLGVPPAEIRERVDAALRDVGMVEYREHAPHRLSGGQKQRVAIAGALAMDPLVLALDEPTAMLDPRGRGEVMETVRRLNRERGVTVVMVTHHMNEAALCGRVVVMDRGRIRLDGTPEDVFLRADELRALGLGVPQTVALARGLGLDAAPLTDEDCARVIFDFVRGGASAGG
ncbi:MAG: energy-coupling factor transporter ATPase [Oscillospiraceae bacterium]|jgi:energy-coupling factor transport system ATP-binding protein|nr:energy-coupling factor transporter ATPase [Oscillospiraceae bacterium]